MKLTDAEVYDLVVPWRGMCPFIEDVSDGSMCECGLPALGHDEAVIRLARQYQRDYFAAVEAIVTARLEQQREAIRVALVGKANEAWGNHNEFAREGSTRLADMYGEEAETWEAAATLVREYQPGEGT